MSEIPQAIISFEPAGTSGVELFLQLTSEIIFRPGVAPTVWSFIATAEELAKLQSDHEVTGKLKLKFDRVASDPGNPTPSDPDPEITIDNCVLIEAFPHELGRDLDGEDVKAITYDVFIADFRRRFVAPRGGLITIGELNLEPIVDGPNPGTKIDRNARAVVSNSGLVTLAMKAMGLENVAVPASADGKPQIKNVNWRAAHAPSELDKLLDELDLIFCPQIDGTVVIADPADEEDPPEIPDDRHAGTMDVRATDRRVPRLCFTSAPTAAFSYDIYTGVASPGGSQTFPAVEYVVFDPITQRWARFSEVSFFQGADPAAAAIACFRQNCANIPEEHRHAIASTLFLCVRVFPEVYGRQPMLSFAAVESPTGWRPRLFAKVAVAGQDGTYNNAADLVEVLGAELADRGRVFKAGAHLIKLEPGQSNVADIHAKALALAPTEIELNAAREVLDQDGNPVFFEAAFKRDETGAIVEITDAAEFKATKAEQLISRPELLLAKIEGVDQNREELVARCKDLAAVYLAKPKPAKQTIITGWFELNLSSRISELAFSQSPPETRIIVDGHRAPSLKPRKPGDPNEPLATQQADSDRRVSGAIGREPEFTPLHGGTPAPSGAGGGDEDDPTEQGQVHIARTSNQKGWLKLFATG